MNKYLQFMNKYFIVLLLGLFLSACANKPADSNQMTIKGTISGDYSGDVNLYKRANGEWVKLDSATVENGSFTLTSSPELPEMYYISKPGDNNFISFFAEPGDISVKTDVNDFKKADITGSKSQDEFIAYQDKMNMFDDMFNNAYSKIKEANEAGDEEAIKKRNKEYQDVEDQQHQFLLDNAMSNNTSVVAAWALDRNSYYFDEDDLEPVLNNFDPSIKESVYVQNLDNRVAILKRVAIGQPAIDFTMTDIEGNPFTLSSLYGKYLLVDFWASWCGPCRRENPNVVEAYKKYNNKGFDILGVSFDQKKEKWVEAVKADNLTWHHVSDLKYWGNEAGKLYGINSIPSNILLDPKGTIIAKNLRGQALQDKLSELLD